MFYGRTKMLPSWKTTDVPTTLRSAAAYVEEHGWTKSMMCDPRSGHVCALGAIAAAAGYNFKTGDTPDYDDSYDYINPHPATKWFAKWISHNFGPARNVDAYREKPYIIVYRWNDNKVQTAEELVQVLRQAADDYIRTGGNIDG